MSSSTNRFHSIQYLRAIAALMVVLHHARVSRPGFYNPFENFLALERGVDIFFVISGFVMYAAARNESPGNFLKKRIIRVVPLYWVVTLTALLIITKFQIFQINGDVLAHVLKSLAFIPHFNLLHPDKIWPYVIPGWTLNYEMLFYLLFFVGLASKRLIPVITLSILGLFVCGQLTAFADPVLRTITHPIILEFLIGAMIALAYLKGNLWRSAWWLLPIGFVGLMALPVTNGYLPFELAKVACSSMIVAGVVALDTRITYFPFGQLLGDASYSIYLTHTVISFRIASKIELFTSFEGWAQFALWVFLTMIVSTVVGIVVHIYIEKPMLGWLRDKWITRGIGNREHGK